MWRRPLAISRIQRTHCLCRCRQKPGWKVPRWLAGPEARPTRAQCLLRVRGCFFCDYMWLRGVPVCFLLGWCLSLAVFIVGTLIIIPSVGNAAKWLITSFICCISITNAFSCFSLQVIYYCTDVVHTSRCPGIHLLHSLCISASQQQTIIFACVWVTPSPQRHP